MPSERVQRQVDRLLDQAETAIAAGDWPTARLHAESALALDETNEDASAYLAAAGKALGGTATDVGQVARSDSPTDVVAQHAAQARPAAPPTLTSFANGRYEVRRFLGEGGKKKVYLAHDTLLDRDVAFALIQTQGLDASA